MIIFIIFMETEGDIKHTTKNKENQKDVSLNDNEHDEQSEEDLAKIGDAISGVIKKNPDLACNIISSFTQGCIFKGEDIKDIGNVITRIIQTDGIKDNPNLACNIINSFAEACITEGGDFTEIGDVISKINKINRENCGPDLVHNNKLIESILVLHKALIPKSDYFSKDEKGLTKVCNAFSKITETDIADYNQDFMFNVVSTLTLNCILQEKDLTEIGDAISVAIKNNPDSAFNIIYDFTQDCISQEIDLKKIGNVISVIIKNNPDLAYNIINSFAKACISEKTDLKKIGDAISGVIKNNPDLAHNIINGFAEACFSERTDLKKICDAISKINKENGGLDLANNNELIKNILVLHKALNSTSDYFSNKEDLTEVCSAFSKIVKNNPNSVFDFTQSCILKGTDSKKIGDVISGVIQTDEIKDNPNLVFDIINGFVQGCLTTKPDNIKDITESFFNLFNSNFGEKEKEIKDKLKPVFSLIVSQYFINILTNSSNKQLSEEDKKQTETQLFECYKELFHVENKQEFQNISLKELLDLQDKYLKERFKKRGVRGGGEYETFLKTAYNLMSKSEGNKELTVKDLEKQKDAFKDLKFIDLDIANSIKSKEQLFHEIGLEQKDFGTDKKGSNFSIVHCTYLNHAFVMIIDKTKEWDDAIKSETESIYLIDSSIYIEDEKTEEDTPLNKKKQIFKTTKTLNQLYQENGTCWLNAMSAVGFLLERQQERIAEQKQEQQEQVEQTEQQSKQPYGLSINKLLEGFNKKRDEESGKIIKSATSQEKLSSFEQGICDYSTEHFYTLTDISDEEKAIIKELLTEKIKQNKADQRKLSTTSSRLEKSKEEQDKTSEEEISKISSESGGLNDENFIIGYNYLKESLERFTQDTEKLKELCAKFDIKDIQLLELEQKEDLSSRKRSIDSCFGEMAIVEEISDMEKPTKYQNIMQQSNNGQEQRNTARAGARTQKAL